MKAWIKMAGQSIDLIVEKTPWGNLKVTLPIAPTLPSDPRVIKRTAYKSVTDPHNVAHILTIEVNPDVIADLYFSGPGFGNIPPCLFFCSFHQGI